jgi:hypothetical protein
MSPVQPEVRTNHEYHSHNIMNIEYRHFKKLKNILLMKLGTNQKICKSLYQYVLRDISIHPCIRKRPWVPFLKTNELHKSAS